MIIRLNERLREERGAALIIGVLLMGVMGTLSVLMLSVGAHSDQSTARGRHWVQALHVAESGIERAIERVEEAEGNIGSPAVTLTGTTDEGSYEVTITRGTRNRYTLESTGSVRAGLQLGQQRKVRVTLAPPLTFENALFSFTTVETKNNDIIDGDVWANNNVILADGTSVTGSVTAASGYVIINSLSSVDGDAWSGGFDPSTSIAIRVRPNATLNGNAKASVTAPPDPVTCGGANNGNYKIRVGNGGLIGGNAETWGTVENLGRIDGTVTNNVCTSAPAAQALPLFSYAAENYNPAPTEYGTPTDSSLTAVSQFQAYVASVGNRISGTFFINQSDPVNQGIRVDLTGVTITGDTTIITNTPIFTNDTTDDTSDAVFMIVSTYRPPVGTVCDVNQDNSECSIHLKNNFSTQGNTAVLVYAPYGPVAIKNNAESFGAIYSDNIQVKNNQTLTYDGRIGRMVGFGDTTLEIERWEEIPPA